MDVQAKTLFAQADVQAERIVAGVRMLVSVVLGVAFLLAVTRTAPEGNVALDRQIILASATIGAYFVLGIGAFAVARPATFRTWMPWVFATFDVAFVVVSVLLGLWNIEVPANFVPSFPAVWLCPLVLAFGALRYNPALQAYVVVALLGAIAAAALLAAPWVGLADVEPPRVLGILFAGPPNIMRLVMLLSAGLVLVVGVYRARALLGRTIEEMRRRARLTRYLPPEIAGWLGDTSAEAARRGQRQQVAILFADIRGFTERAEGMDPADLGGFVGAFRQRVTDAVTAHHGVVDKFIGDSAMVVFGVPVSGPEDASRALACGRQILANIEDWNRERRAEGLDPVYVGVGGHRGEVFCGAVGDENRLEFAVLGDTVNVAARIEEMTKTAGFPFVVSQDLIDAAGADAADASWKPLPPKRLRGRHRPVQPYGWGVAE